MDLKIIPSKDWKAVSEDAHRTVFHQIKPASNDRIDYALLVVESDTPVGYVTCREWASDTVYWQFGGTFPGSQGTTRSFKAYGLCLDYARKHYARVTTLIENDNHVMLKMAAKVGFQIIGVRHVAGSTLLEHLLEFTEEK